jgi:hypothetical protein
MINHLHTFEYATKFTTDKRTYSRYNQWGATGGNWMNDRQTSCRLVFNIVDELHVIKNAGKWEKNLPLSLACFVQSIYYSYASIEQIFQLTFSFNVLYSMKTNTNNKKKNYLERRKATS